jgi:hypothetical protein
MPTNGPGAGPAVAPPHRVQEMSPVPRSPILALPNIFGSSSRPSPRPASLLGRHRVGHGPVQLLPSPDSASTAREG